MNLREIGFWLLAIPIAIITIVTVGYVSAYLTCAGGGTWGIPILVDVCPILFGRE